MAKEYGIDFETVECSPTRFWVFNDVIDVQAYLTQPGYDVTGGFEVLLQQ